MNYQQGVAYLLTLQWSCRAGYEDEVFPAVYVGRAEDDCAIFAGDGCSYHVFESGGSLWLDDMVTVPVVVERA
jgi:hypothetical protein